MGVTPEQALDMLQEGNGRFLQGALRHPHLDPARLRAAYEEGQHPFAVILACADSRVPVELLFDQGCGDLFVIRLAGNIATSAAIGSIEFAVSHLDSPLVLVLGHSHCGAVTAALNAAEVDGCLGAVLDSVRPAVDRARAANPAAGADALLAAAVRENVWCAIETMLARSPEVRRRVGAGAVHILGAVYHIATGTVDWLGPHPEAARLLLDADAAAAAGHAV